MDICFGSVWRTPCQDTWGIEETQVVCRELGFCQQGGMLAGLSTDTSIAITKISFPYTGRLVTGQSYQDYIPYDISEVNCTGDEATLSGCSVIYPASNCGNYVGAGVSCYSSKSCVEYMH